MITTPTVIPTVLRNDNFRFIKLRGKTKIPQEPDFTKAANFAYDDPSLLRHLEKGYNYGVLGGQDGFIEIDADHEPLISELENKLPKTFTTKTPHKGIHKYLKTDDPHTGALLDTIEDVNGDRANLGHVTGYGRQVVGPGCSIIENGEELFYTIVDASPIAEIKWSELSKILGAFFVKDKKQKRKEDDDDNKEKAEYVFTNDKFQNIMDVVENPDDFVDEGERYRGFPLFSNHKKTPYFLIYPKTNTWYSHKDEKGGHIPQLIALQEKIITLEESLKGKKYWEAIKIMKDKYGIFLAKDFTPETKDVFYRDEEGRKKINFEILINNIWNAYVFKTFEDTEELLVYDKGIYRNGVTLVKAYLERVLGPRANKHIVSEMIAHIQRRSYTQRVLFNINSKYIPLENGLLNLENFKIEDFDAEKLYTFRIPVEYNAAAGYTHIIDFFKEILHPEDIDTMQELFGYVLYAGYPAHKSMWWLGKGRNGKTTTESLLTALIGIENVAGVPLKQLDGNHKFAVMRLFGKLVNIVAEPETRNAMQTPTFKAATGGDIIFGECKNIQKDFPFVNFATFVIYANRVPKIDDPTFAFWERVIAIDFPHTFTKDKAKKDYYKTVIAQDTVAGLLNWSLEGLKRLQKSDWEFTETQTQKDAKNNMQRQAQPLKTFLDEWTEFDNEGDIPKASLFDAFKIYCDVYGLLIPTENEFTRELKRNTNIEMKRLNMEDWDISGRVLCWRGIKINENIEVFIPDMKNEDGVNCKIGDNYSGGEKMKIYTLLDYLRCQGCHTCHTFSYIEKCIGEKRVLMANKELFPLYMKISEITYDKYDECDKYIKFTVKAAMDVDERGAMKTALINHVAKHFHFSVKTIKEEIEKMFRDGELVSSSQDFVKVVDMGSRNEH